MTDVTGIDHRRIAAVQDYLHRLAADAGGIRFDLLLTDVVLPSLIRRLISTRPSRMK